MEKKNASGRLAVYESSADLRAQRRKPPSLLFSVGQSWCSRKRGDKLIIVVDHSDH